MVVRTAKEKRLNFPAPSTRSKHGGRRQTLCLKSLQKQPLLQVSERFLCALRNAWPPGHTEAIVLRGILFVFSRRGCFYVLYLHVEDWWRCCAFSYKMVRTKTSLETLKNQVNETLKHSLTLFQWQLSKQLQFCSIFSVF